MTFDNEAAYFRAAGVTGFFGSEKKRAARTERLKAERHDGIIIWEREQLRGKPAEYVACRPDRVKSAIRTRDATPRH